MSDDLELVKAPDPEADPVVKAITEAPDEETVLALEEQNIEQTDNGVHPGEPGYEEG